VGDGHACVLLDDFNVRCWGFGIDGRLGYGDKLDVGDDGPPGTVGPVALGPGRTARAVALGARHTCARLDDGSVRCWGYGANGRLGLCSERNVGDDELPGSVGPVDLGVPGIAAAACAPRAAGGGARYPPPQHAADRADPLKAEAVRRAAFRACLRRAARHSSREIRRARRLSGARRVRARAHAKRHRHRLRRACVRRHGRKPGRVRELRAQVPGRARIVLRFAAPGSDRGGPPPARSYLVKQSRRPIRSSRDFRRAQTLCKGRCRFPNVTKVGATLELSVSDLRRRTTYYYAVAARDNVSGRLGRRSTTAKATTR
jgi:hypothetical protein